MTKEVWLKTFKDALQKMPRREASKAVAFYREMIEDKIDAGACEDEVIVKLGNPSDVAKKILEENGIRVKSRDTEKASKEELDKLYQSRFPLWVTLTLGFFGVIVGLPIVIVWFALLVSFFACFISLMIGAFACCLASLVAVVLGLVGTVGNGWAYFGACIAGAGVCMMLTVMFGVLAKLMIKATAFAVKRIATEG